MKPEVLTCIRQLRDQGYTWDEVSARISEVGNYDDLSGDQWRKRFQRATSILGFGIKRPVQDWTFNADRPRKHLVIPDTQLKPGVPMQHLYWIGQYIALKKPQVVVQLGDWADMHSLSSYDRGKRSGENSRYAADIAVANEGIAELERGMAGFKPELKLFILGNHEQRIERFVNDHPELHGALDYSHFDWERRGWTVAPFLQPVEVDGVLYSHFFPRAPNGRVLQTRYGAPNAKTQVQREHQSATAGHTPGIDLAIVAGGKRLLRGLQAGSCYLHDEDYMGPQGNMYWRGIIVKHGVHNGDYDLMTVSLDYLSGRFG